MRGAEGRIKNMERGEGSGVEGREKERGMGGES